MPPALHLALQENFCNEQVCSQRLDSSDEVHENGERKQECEKAKSINACQAQPRPAQALGCGRRGSAWNEWGPSNEVEVLEFEKEHVELERGGCSQLGHQQAIGEGHAAQLCQPAATAQRGADHHRKLAARHSRLARRYLLVCYTGHACGEGLPQP